MIYMNTTGQMNQEMLVRQSQVGDSNWWIAVRKSLFQRTFNEMKISQPMRALEIGPGAGSNLEIFEDLGISDVHIADVDYTALEMCKTYGTTSGILLDASALPYSDESFDLILVGDVLEHVTNHEQAAREIVRVLKTGGRAIVTVPAFRVLWSEHDEQAGHQRRYRLHEFKKLFSELEIKIERCHYFNWVLFLPTLITKKIMTMVRPTTYVDATTVPSQLNSLLKLIFAFDVRVSKTLHPPFGISIIVVLDKPIIE
jgi:SAM-dependent methyltransferase